MTGEARAALGLASREPLLFFLDCQFSVSKSIQKKQADLLIEFRKYVGKKLRELPLVAEVVLRNITVATFVC